MLHRKGPKKSIVQICLCWDRNLPLKWHKVLFLVNSFYVFYLLIQMFGLAADCFCDQSWPVLFYKDQWNPWWFKLNEYTGWSAQSEMWGIRWRTEVLYLYIPETTSKTTFMRTPLSVVIAIIDTEWKHRPSGGDPILHLILISQNMIFLSQTNMWKETPNNQQCHVDWDPFQKP